MDYDDCFSDDTSCHNDAENGSVKSNFSDNGDKVNEQEPSSPSSETRDDLDSQNSESNNSNSQNQDINFDDGDSSDGETNSHFIVPNLDGNYGSITSMSSYSYGNHLKYQNSYNEMEYHEIYENYLNLKNAYEEARIKVNNIIEIDFTALEPRNRLLIHHLTCGNQYI